MSNWVSRRQSPDEIGPHVNETKPALIRTPADQNPEAFKKGSPPPVRFAPGTSGNPGGFPKLARALRDAARGHGNETLSKLQEFCQGMVQQKQAVTEYREEFEEVLDNAGRVVKLKKLIPYTVIKEVPINIPVELQLSAVGMMLDRAMGKPTQPIVPTDSEGSALPVGRIERVIVTFDNNGGEQHERVDVIESSARDVTPRG